jgi:hypothetical protein
MKLGQDYELLCVFCDEPVNPNSRFTYRSMKGFHRPGKAGGSDVVLREDTGQYAHPQCVDRERMGVSHAQQELV